MTLIALFDLCRFDLAGAKGLLIYPNQTLGPMMRSFFLSLLCLFIASSAQAAWHKVQSPNFIVYSDGKPDQTVEFTRRVERFDTFLRGKFGASTQPAAYKLTIFLVGSNNPAAMLKGGNSRAIRGFYDVGPDGPIAVVDRLPPGDKFSLDADTVLFHEYVHHFMFQYTSGAYPAWFVEGFAEFYSTTEFDKEGRAMYGRPPYYRAYDLLATKPLPIEKLLTAQVGELTRDETSSLYARGWLLTHYLTFESTRAGQLEKYMTAIRSGTLNLDAAKAAFGDLKALDKDLSAYLKRKRVSYLTQTKPTTITGAVDHVALDEGEAATLVERIKTMRGLHEEETPAVIATLERARAKHARSAAIPALIAQIHYGAERDKDAIAAADAALAINPAEPRAMLYKGAAQIREMVRNDISDAAQWKAARAFVVKANRTQPDNPYPLYFYYRSFADQGVAPPELALRGLARAQQLVPQDGRFRFTYAHILIREKRYKDALVLIKPVAFDPHGGSDYARNIVTRLEKAIATGKPIEASEELIEPAT